MHILVVTFTITLNSIQDSKDWSFQMSYIITSQGKMPGKQFSESGFHKDLIK